MIVVGGAFVISAIAVFMGLRIARRAALSAGVIVLGWLAVQMAIIGYVSWMQPTTAVAGLLIIVLARSLGGTGSNHRGSLSVISGPAVRHAGTANAFMCNMTLTKARTTLARQPHSRSGSPTMRERPSEVPQVHGHVSHGFEVVRETFVENFARRRELGAGCCAYHRGEKVVDLWGGIRNKQTGEPWEQDTMVLVYSATKGLAAMTLAIAHSRGWLDYEERVCVYWPEFAQQGKEKITVRQLLAHQAGLFAFDEPVDRSVVANLDRLAVVLARQKPAWEPGTRQAYHAISLGFYEGELLRRVDPRHRSLGQFFQDEIATPLGLDLFIRLPEEIPNSRLATLAPPRQIDMVLHFPLRLAWAGMNRRSNIYRALMTNPGFAVVHDKQRVYARNLEVPSGGAVGTARAIAHAYGVFATGGRVLGLRQETLDLLAAPAIPPTRGFYDECLKGDGVQFSLGFMKPSSVWPFGSARSFGSPGSGGSLGFADPTAGIGYAYVSSQMGTRLTGDPRDIALREALYLALQAREGLHSGPEGRDRRD